MQITCFSARAGIRIQTRSFSTTSSRLRAYGVTYSRTVRTSQYIQLLARETHDPVWRLMQSLDLSRRSTIDQALHKNGIPRAEFDSWKDAMHESNIDYALPMLAKRGYRVEESGEPAVNSSTRPVPSWLLLYLVGYKVRTPHHASEAMLSLVFPNLPSMSPKYRAGLLIFTMLHLARFNLVSPMGRTIEAFLTIPFPPSHLSSIEKLHFNLLLQSMSRTPVRSTAIADLVLRILKTMETRGLHLHDDTYRMLLDDRFVTVQLTKYLRERMVNEGFVPKVEHLEAYLKIFAKNGLIRDAGRYQEAIHSLKSPSEDPYAKPFSNTPANIQLVASQPDRASAFDFLRKLSNDPPARSLFRAGPRRTFSIYGWTAAFYAALKDVNTSTKTIMRMINSANKSRATRPRGAFRPTTVTYTVLMYGLLRRHNWELAEKAWYELHTSGLPIDGMALTAGVEALTRVGRPHKAFRLLETFCSRVDAASPAQYKVFRPVTINIIGMNQFLVALLMIRRPDVVFMMWEWMDVLYGVNPNERTLSIVLRAGRMAGRMDDTIRGKMEEWKVWMKTPSEGPKAEGKESPTREKVLEEITSLIYAPAPSGSHRPALKPYVSGLWRNRPAIIRLKSVFCEILFRYNPSLSLVTTSPVRAIQSNVGQSKFSWFRVLPDLNMGERRVQWVLPSELGGRHNSYPGVVPSDDNFKTFMVLIGTTPYPSDIARSPSNTWTDQDGVRFEQRSLLELSATEIPLLLLWMRELDIEPSRPTLFLALALWREVNLQAPLIEMWSSGVNNNKRKPWAESLTPASSNKRVDGGTQAESDFGKKVGPGQMQYQDLVEWLKDWLGDKVPKEGDPGFAKWRLFLERKRAEDLTEWKVKTDPEKDEDWDEDVR